MFYEQKKKEKIAEVLSRRIYIIWFEIISNVITLYDCWELKNKSLFDLIINMSAVHVLFRKQITEVYAIRVPVVRYTMFTRTGRSIAGTLDLWI